MAIYAIGAPALVVLKMFARCACALLEHIARQKPLRGADRRLARIRHRGSHRIRERGRIHVLVEAKRVARLGSVYCGW